MSAVLQDFWSKLTQAQLAQREQLSIAYIFYHYTGIVVSLYKIIVLLDNALDFM